MAVPHTVLAARARISVLVVYSLLLSHMPPSAVMIVSCYKQINSQHCQEAG